MNNNFYILIHQALMKSLVKAKGNRYFSKDFQLLKTFLVENKNALHARQKTEISIISSIKINSPVETPLNKSQHISLKVKELIKKNNKKQKRDQRTRENQFDSKMKAFSDLESYIDTSNLFKNLNRLNELNKENSQSENKLKMKKFLSNIKIIGKFEETEEDEEPIFMIDDSPTTKFPRLKIKEELLEKARGVIKTLHKNKINLRPSFQFNDCTKEQWNIPEIRSIGKNSLDPKTIKSSIALENQENTKIKRKIKFRRPPEKTDLAKIEQLEETKEKKEKKDLRQLQTKFQTYEKLESPKSPKITRAPKSSNRIRTSVEICNYLLKESKEYSEEFEERFLDDLKSGKFLWKLDEDKEEKIERKVKQEMSRFNHFLQNNNKVSKKLKDDLKTGVYAEVFRDQAEKLGTLLKRAARNMFDEREKFIEESLQKKNQKLKNRINEISDFMRRQNLNSLSKISKEKYLKITSRYNSNFSISTNPIENNSNNKIIIAKSKTSDSLENEKSESENPETRHKSILKKRILSPIFLTDEKTLMNINTSKIEKEESLALMSPIIKIKPNFIKKEKSLLYEASNLDFEKIWMAEQNKKHALKIQNKKVNQELKQKFERLLNELDESKVYHQIEKMEMSKDIMQIQKKWEEIDDKTKGVDTLRLLAMK